MAMSEEKLQCRLCTSDQALISMFSGINRQGRDYLRKMILDIIHIKVEPDDAYPKYVCLKCAVHISNFFKFSQICKETDQKLRDSPSNNNKKFSGIKVCDIKASDVQELIVVVDEYLDKKTREICNYNKTVTQKLPNSVPKATVAVLSQSTQTLELHDDRKNKCKCNKKLIDRTDSQTQTYTDYKTRCTQTGSIKNRNQAIQVELRQKPNKKRESKSRHSQTISSALKNVEIQTDIKMDSINSNGTPVASLLTINCENLFKPNRKSFDSLSPGSSFSNIVPRSLIESISDSQFDSNSIESQNEEKSLKNDTSVNQNSKSDKINIVSNISVEAELKTDDKNTVNNLNAKHKIDKKLANKKSRSSTEKAPNNNLVLESESQCKKSTRTTKIINSVITNEKKENSQLEVVKNSVLTNNTHKQDQLLLTNNSEISQSLNNIPLEKKLPLEKKSTKNKKLDKKLLIEVKPKVVHPKRKSLEKPNDPRSNVKKVLDFDNGLLVKNINIPDEQVKKDLNKLDDSLKLNNSISNNVFEFKSDDEASMSIDKSYKNLKLDVKNNSKISNDLSNKKDNNLLNNNIEQIKPNNINKDCSEINNSEKIVNDTLLSEANVADESKHVPLSSNKKRRSKDSKGRKRKINVDSLTKSKKIKLSPSWPADNLNTSNPENSIEKTATPEKLDLPTTDLIPSQAELDSAKPECDYPQSNNTPISKTNHLLSPSITDLLTIKKCRYQHVCRTCNNTFNSLLEVRRHQRLHMRCPICKMKFRSIIQTQKHQETCKMANVQAQVKLIRLDEDTKLLEAYPDVKEYLCSKENC